MRKLKEVLRLDSLGLSQHQIARSCSISQSTVHEYVSAARAVGVKWPLPETWDDQQIGQMLFPQRPTPAVWRKHPEPDWTHIHQDLQTHKDLTLQLVWQECRENNPDGYAYSRFCDLYRHWLKKLDLVLRQEHRAGEKMFVDYAGATIPIYDPETEELQPGAVFVAVLGASNYTFAEVTLGQGLRNWIGSHSAEMWRRCCPGHQTGDRPRTLRAVRQRLTATSLGSIFNRRTAFYSGTSGSLQDSGRARPIHLERPTRLPSRIFLKKPYTAKVLRARSGLIS